MISGDMIRGYTDLMILYFLWDKPSYGYQLSKLIKAKSISAYEMKETTLYSAINRLHKHGYVTAFKKVANNGKQRTYYQISNSGCQYYHEKCLEWVETVALINQFIRGDQNGNH